MNIKKYIPNILTLINLFSGCLLVYFTLYYSLTDQKFPEEFINIALILLSISLIADLLDGMVARWLNVASPIGLQLDSLADMVTFGVFPGFLMAKMFNQLKDTTIYEFPAIAFFGLSITLFSALRLAKFNVDTSQISYFKGLATPANTIMIFGIYLLLPDIPLHFLQDYGTNSLISITVISSFLLVADLPLFSFKLKSLKLKDILPQVILLITSVILLVFIGLKSLFIIIILYIILSIIFKKTFTHAST
ncbi:MAG: CDP-alcohol phosphatidyltransferase family protein [Weeksellaceae bacterium]